MSQLQRTSKKHKNKNVCRAQNMIQKLWFDAPVKNILVMSRLFICRTFTQSEIKDTQDPATAS